MHHAGGAGFLTLSAGAPSSQHVSKYGLIGIGSGMGGDGIGGREIVNYGVEGTVDTKQGKNKRIQREGKQEHSELLRWVCHEGGGGNVWNKIEGGHRDVS